MRGRRFAGAVAAGAVLVGLLATPAQATEPAPTPAVQGNRLVDTRTGATFVPHGVNWPSFEYACWQGWGYSAAIADGEEQVMASWGINAVRLPLNQDCWLGLQGSPKGTGRTAEGYRAAVESWVRRLNAAGIVVILDLHTSAPAGHPARWPHAMADAQSATFWTSVAGRFATNPSVMFDLFNEPYSRWNDATGAWQFQLTWTCWRDGGCAAPVEDDYTDVDDYSGATYPVQGMAGLVAAIRAAGAPQPVLLGGLDYSNDLRGWLANRPTDPQLVAAWHNYPGQRCHTQACWEAEIAPVAAVVPVVAGEFGQTDGGSGFLTGFMTWADAHGIGYLPWAWWDVPASEDLANSRYALIDSALQPKAPAGTAFHDHLAGLASSATSTVLTASHASQVYGSPRVVLTARVTSTGAAPTGTVTFLDGAIAIGSAAVGADGLALFRLPATLRARVHTLTASFAPSSPAQPPSVSAAVTVTVTKATSQVSISVTPATVARRSAWSIGVTVGVPGITKPTGTLSVYCDQVLIGSWPLAAASAGRVTLDPRPIEKAGSRQITVVYSGTGDITGSTSPPALLRVT